MNVERKQAALQADSMTRVQSPQIQGGENVCVWDATGQFWCEGKGNSGVLSYIPRVSTPTPGDPVGKAILFEGFCGCGAEPV